LELDLAEAQLQGVARDVEKIIGSIGESDLKLTTLCRRRAQRLSIQRLLHCGRAILSGIDERDPVSERARNRDAEQRIMGAAKHERVDPVGKQGLKITDNDPVGYVVVEQSFFDQRDEQRTRETAHAHIVVGRA
jgi:hypothetical protein